METTLPLGRANVAGWIQELPSGFQDPYGGIMNDMVSLTVRFVAAVKDKEAAPVQEMLDLLEKFSLLIDGNSDLDQTLEVGSYSDSPMSNSNGTSSSYNRCKTGGTTFSDPAELRRVDPLQNVVIWHCDGQSMPRTVTCLFDSGASDNLICRSIVTELDHEVTQCRTKIIIGIGGQAVEVSELVRPKWQFEQGLELHEEITFFVVPEIPGGFDMLLSGVTLEYLGLHFRLDPGRVLVVQADHEDQSTSDQHQQLYGRQQRDGNAEMAKIRQNALAKRTELFSKRDADNAANKTKPQALTSQENTTRSGDNHG